MRTYTAVVERDPDTGWYVGYIPGFPGAHTQGENLDELQRNLREVLELLQEDGEPCKHPAQLGAGSPSPPMAPPGCSFG